LNIRNLSFNNQTIVTQIKGSSINKSELILGTETEGIFSYDTKTNKFNNLKLNNNFENTDSNIFIRTIDIDNKGNIWYARNNSLLEKLDHSIGKVTSYKPPYYKHVALPFNIQSIKINPICKI
jgi:streptogramin lyase